MEDIRLRKCSSCKKMKPVDEFREAGTDMGRYFKNCHDCGGTVVPQYPEMKKCAICGETKVLDDFKRSSGRGRSLKNCRECSERINAGKTEWRKAKAEKETQLKKARAEWLNKKKEVASKGVFLTDDHGSFLELICPVCGLLKERGDYCRQGVGSVTEDTACNDCMGTKEHEIWKGDMARKYNREKQRLYREKKKEK